MEHIITLKICLVVVRDEYKEFEKLIQEDLQEVDDRFEEEEVRVKYNQSVHFCVLVFHVIYPHYKLKTIFLLFQL